MTGIAGSVGRGCLGLQEPLPGKLFQFNKLKGGLQQKLNLMDQRFQGFGENGLAYFFN
jgi:hypothetical protein